MKWHTKLLVAAIFTHGVTYAHGHNRGVFAAFESIDKQTRNMQRLSALKDAQRRGGVVKPLPDLTGSDGRAAP